MRPYGSVRGASGNGRPYRDSTQIENNELELALSVFIGVYLWPDCFFRHPVSLV